MSTRRIPLSSNINAANSPLRPSGHLNPKHKTRSHADMMRDEPYGQPPPAKRQQVDHGVRRAVASPTRPKATKTIVHRASKPPSTLTKEMEDIRIWQTQIRARFPKHVFYFESVPEDQRPKLAKLVAQLGAREEKFFSIDITHVVTTRPVPPEKSLQADADQHAAEQPKTIDPSLLHRNLDPGTARRKLLFDTSSRRIPLQIHEDAIKRPKTRSADVLVRARDMGKKIWPLEKFQRILDVALEEDPYKSAVLNRGRGAAQSGKESNLLQLLQNERVHGPSDRDPTVVTKELHYFKGPYIYVYDIEEKTKPIMVREYNKVADKKDGDWPQFRVASQGRCPFVEDFDEKEARTQPQAKEKVAKTAVTAPQAAMPKPVTGKRTLVEMEDGHNRGASRARDNALALDFRAPNQNAFMSRAKSGRLLAGEPVASGLQQSNITSAIRSQMISSTSGVLGAKAGTSREIHGLQRKVLQKASTPAVSQDPSSRQVAEMSHDSNGFLRSASLSRATSRKLEAVEEDGPAKPKEKLRRTVSVPVALTKKREKKPGYCENCQDKFDDFEDHILARKHRKFADNNDNWAQLDALLGQLKRLPLHSSKKQW
ncbi:Dfp1/Him1, central region-domain-containing protein [Podospora conica]|nr:Dfp1/Him1, central region-domain-containing protein [Schizothecium conicum]